MASPGIKFFALLLAACMFLPLKAQRLLEGDLLFVCSESENPITQVTSGVEDLPIDHVAIVHRIGGDDGVLFVIEAIKPKVCLTPIDRFLRQNEACVVLAGRVNVPFDVRRSIKRCLRMVGKPYDDLYLPGDSALYCSELVQMNFVTDCDSLVFTTIPMSFHDDSGQIIDYWREFYSRRGMEVPEGEPGTNPGELSRRPQVTILGKYPIQL